MNLSISEFRNFKKCWVNDDKIGIDAELNKNELKKFKSKNELFLVEFKTEYISVDGH